VQEVTTGSERPSGLHDVLRERGINRIIVVGLAQDVCVKETVLDGRRLGYETVVPLTATRAVSLEPDDARRAFEAMVAAGAMVHRCVPCGGTGVEAEDRSRSSANGGDE
jgi:nicotinamidase/pyrazinamidase